MNSITVNVAAHCGIDLSSRGCASLLRDDIVQSVGYGHDVVIDFSDVRTLSESFADELLAVLVVTQGEEWFVRHISVVNLRDDQRTTVLEAIQNRLNASLAAI